MTVRRTQSKSSPATEADPRWHRVLSRDLQADGQFWYSVKTTGVYCRPSCGSRLPRIENVLFHDKIAAARAMGFRPCKRCLPDGPTRESENARIVAEACRLMERSDRDLSLLELADAAKLSAGYFHRVFKRATGLTPKEYAGAHRAQRVRRELVRGQTVTEALYDAGFNSNSRFYEKSNELLGMVPSRYRAGGPNESIRFAIGQCSLGAILVASSDKGITTIQLGNDPERLIRDLQDKFTKARLIGDDRRYREVVAKVVAVVERPRMNVDLPLDVRGTAFQQLVWQALRSIAPGKTVTYSQIAAQIGSPKAARAVARACAANNIAVAIPCHRVVRLDESISGYRWGVERQRILLKRERPQRSRKKAK